MIQKKAIHHGLHLGLLGRGSQMIGYAQSVALIKICSQKFKEFISENNFFFGSLFFKKEHLNVLLNYNADDKT
jgi:hypothetical protein